MRTLASVRLLSVIAAGLAGASLLQAQAPSAPHTRLLESYGRLPLHFEPNQGQVDPQVTFLARGSGYSLFLTPTEAVLALRDRGASGAAVLRLTLAGANPSPDVTGRDELPGKINYFVGNDSARWRTNIATYARVLYSEVYPGIDLVYYGNQRQLEYDFVVAPGADPGRIRMSFDGAGDIRIDASGDLILPVAGGDLRQHKPVVYQEVQGVRQEIAGRYVMKGERQIGFELGVYDEGRPLVIDPILVYSTYLGGASSDEGNDIAVDADGYAYVTGETDSNSFPTTSDAFDTDFSGIAGGNADAFVTKLDFTGSTLVYSTYLGGDATDRGNGIAVDADGNAYIAGETLATTSPNKFPVTSGAFDTTQDGQDAFVTKLNTTGSGLLYSTFLGGTGVDEGNDIAVDSLSNAYVTGRTLSSDFPTTAGAVQSAYGGGTTGDAFLTKLHPTGSGYSQLVYSTYLGGSGVDVGNGIAVDLAGNVYVTGTTPTTATTRFPTTASAYDTIPNGGNDVFVAKLDPTVSGLAGLVYSTYLGGSGTESGNGIAVDPAGNVYVTGTTPTTATTRFPTTASAYDTIPNGGNDVFVAKLDPMVSGLDGLVYSTFLGGSSTDSGNGIAVDAAGNAYVTGQTSSSGVVNGFPTKAAFQSVNAGGNDAYVTKLDTNASGTLSLVYSTYLGGSGSDIGNGIAVDAAGSAYVTGGTSSTLLTPFPTTVGAYDTSHNGSQDAFVAKIGDALVPASVTLDPPQDTNPVASEHCVTATVEDSAGNHVPGVTVRFEVNANGAVTASGSGTTDANGQAEFCYTGPETPRTDAISAFADTDTDGTQDVNEPSGGATKTWVPGSPATLTLTPAAAANPVGAQHCVTATVRDAFHNATPGITVRFHVTGAVNTTGSATTSATGEAVFCYTGPSLPGADSITAYADTDDDNVQDAGEPAGTAAKTWVLPASSAACKVTDGGHITTINGARAIFGGVARSTNGVARGIQAYEEHGQDSGMRVRSLNVLAVVCQSPTEATIFGEAWVNGSSRVYYRIDVKDMGEPGRGNDWYSILLSDGYTSGEQILNGGNIQIH